jgi:hypothetical protein
VYPRWRNSLEDWIGGDVEETVWLDDWDNGDQARSVKLVRLDK